MYVRQNNKSVDYESLKDTEFRVIVNEVLLNTFRYADDTLIFCDNMESLQQLINKVSSAGMEQELNVNVIKAKFMVLNLFMVFSWGI